MLQLHMLLNHAQLEFGAQSAVFPVALAVRFPLAPYRARAASSDIMVPGPQEVGHFEWKMQIGAVLPVFQSLKVVAVAVQRKSYDGICGLKAI